MRRVPIMTVMIDGMATKNGMPVFDEKGELVKELKPFNTGKMLDELVWGDPQFSESEGPAGCLERNAERFGEATEGYVDVEDTDHELISKKLKEWFPKDQQGQKGAGNRTTRRIRQLVNSFVFAPRVDAKAPELANGSKAAALPAASEASAPASDAS